MSAQLFIGVIEMSNSLPGSSYSNPIWYRNKWRIYASSYIPMHGTEVSYQHDDYDGAPDSGDTRYGYAPSIEAAQREIDDWEHDRAEYEKDKRT
jgi:hypothetical protein